MESDANLKDRYYLKKFKIPSLKADGAHLKLGVLSLVPSFPYDFQHLDLQLHGRFQIIMCVTLPLSLDNISLLIYLSQGGVS